jgi:hypothetical protein
MKSLGIRGALARTKAFLFGLSLGAAWVYYLDADRGAYRRAVLRDRTLHLFRRAGAELDAGLRDLAHRAQGLGARARQALVGGAVPDLVLVERVRAQMGRGVSHSRAIEVRAERGIVTLKGPILATEVESLVSRVKSVRGVRDVERELELHHTADIPALMGGLEPRTRRRGVLFRSSSPATRLVVGTAGALLALRGLRSRNATAYAFAGALLLGGALVRPRRREEEPAERAVKPSADSPAASWSVAYASGAASPLQE